MIMNGSKLVKEMMKRIDPQKLKYENLTLNEFRDKFIDWIAEIEESNSFFESDAWEWAAIQELCKIGIITDFRYSSENGFRFKVLSNTKINIK